MDFTLLLSFSGLFVSLIFLWWAGSLSVSYSIQMADIFNLNRLFIGFVLISISTGLPELSIVLSSVFRGVEDVSAGDLLGSNVCDISLVLGLAIMIYGSLKIGKKDIKQSLILLSSTAISMAAIFILGTLHWIEGIVFILIYFIVIGWLWFSTKQTEILEEQKIQERIYEEKLLLDIEDRKIKKSDIIIVSPKDKLVIIAKLLGAIILVLVASEFAVQFAINITNSFELSLKTIGATIFAIGTSLPEISLSLNAMRKKEYSLALGNSLGSVLEQGTLLIGILALISGKPIDTASFRSLVPFMFFPFFLIGFSIVKRKKISRIEAALMLTVYAIFLIYQYLFVK